LAEFLRGKGRKHKVLAYVDPFGMQLEWRSIEALAGLSVDMWILVPTGMGVNRLLKKNGEISEAWLNRLSVFLGMEVSEIVEFFYTEKTVSTLFGLETALQKEENAIEKSAELYKERLGTIFEFVTNPFVLKTKSNNVLYHFFMASNNRHAVKNSE
jgi:three-Cys-motif partner protein